ncbi:MAG TPA: hypothetical protein PKC15_06535 [Rhodocyclaceae bacterium]|nr:hypothetical protein [Rhodocyclaceae bacterium]
MPNGFCREILAGPCQAGEHLCVINALAEGVIAIRDERAGVQTDPAGELQSRQWRQIPDTQADFARGLEGSICVDEQRKHGVATRPTIAPSESFRSPPHAFETTIDGVDVLVGYAGQGFAGLFCRDMRKQDRPAYQFRFGDDGFCRCVVQRVVDRTDGGHVEYSWRI